MPDRITVLIVSMFLGAIVAANLLVARFGHAALVIGAVLLIPIDLATRDVLHERWEGRGLWTRMGLLIASGSVLTALLNVGATRVAIGSFAAFSLSALTNALVYQGMSGHPRLVKMNVSNFPAVVVDSIVFPLVAVPDPVALLIIIQIVGKFLGGAGWSVLLVRILPGFSRPAV